MTKQEYVDAVIRLGRQRGVSITQADAESSLVQALDALSGAVAFDERAPLLQRRFRAAYTALTGDAPFSTVALDTGGTLVSVNISSIRTDTIGVVKYDDGAGNITTFHRIAGDGEIDYERQCEFFFYDPYIVLNAKIRARKASDTPDAGTLADGYLTFQANYTPDIAGLPGELDTDLVIFGVGISKSEALAAE